MGDTSTSQIDHRHHLYLQPSDTPEAILINIKLIGLENYGLWSKSMRLDLFGKNKLCFVEETCMKSLYRCDLPDLWELCNIVVLSWIGRSVSQELQRTIVYASYASKVGAKFKERFYKSNLTRFYSLWTQIETLTQCTNSITTYFNRMKELWDEQVKTPLYQVVGVIAENHNHSLKHSINNT